MNYYEISVFGVENYESKDILIANLAEIEYESFVDSDKFDFLAYIKQNDFKLTDLQELQKSRSFDFTYNLIKDENWNAKWEENYEAVLIDDIVEIHAPFHTPNPKAQFHIEIEPKMSFGTAHHPTTAQMISLIKSENLKEKVILDMGCGTAVLGILGMKMGAKSCCAIDNDEWAFNNSLENVERNKITNVEVLLGEADLLKNKKFDIIFANINRNILVKDMQMYAQTLAVNGVILFSGFFINDLEIIKNEALKNQLVYDKHIVNNDWVAARFIKL